MLTAQTSLEIKEQPKKYLEKYSDDRISLIQKDYINVKCYSCIKMGQIYPNCPGKTQEESVNDQATIEQSTSETAAALSTTTNQTYEVAG